MGLEHARVGGQLERAQPDGVDGHLEGNCHNRDSNCSLYYKNVHRLGTITSRWKSSMEAFRSAMGTSMSCVHLVVVTSLLEAFTLMFYFVYLDQPGSYIFLS